MTDPRNHGLPLGPYPTWLDRPRRNGALLRTLLGSVPLPGSHLLLELSTRFNPSCGPGSTA